MMNTEWTDRSTQPPHEMATPEEVILNISVMYLQDQSSGESYTDGSDTHFSTQSDPHTDTRGSPAPNLDDQDSPDIKHAESDISDSAT